MGNRCGGRLWLRFRARGLRVSVSVFGIHLGGMFLFLLGFESWFTY
jgi:hypothetical protein